MAPRPSSTRAVRLLAITPPATIAVELDLGLIPIWLEAGAGELGLAVLLREPGASPRQLLADARLLRLREALADRGVPAFLSLAPAAPEPEGLAQELRRATPPIAGAQLRGDPSAELCARWRALLPGFTVGRSVHGLAPTHADVDYSCLAPIHAPSTAQPGVIKEPIGLAGLRRWTAVRDDVIALGGVTPHSASACLDAGARGLAGIRLFFGPRAETAQYVASVCQAFARARAGAEHGPPKQARGRGAPPQGS